MKNIIISISLVFLFAGCLDPFKGINDKQPGILALKHNRKYNYKIGTRVKVFYNNNDTINKVKGRLKKLTPDGFYLSGFRKHDTAFTYIAVQSLVSITELLRTERVVSGIAIGTTAIATTLLAYGLSTATPTPDSGFAVILFIYPLAFGFTGLIVFPLTYLEESLKQKSLKRGWHFVIQ